MMHPRIGTRQAPADEHGNIAALDTIKPEPCT